jgi:UDP-N-acetylmuramate--alanine ligase
MTRQLFEHFPKKILFYGFDDKNDFVIKGQSGKYDLFENTATARKKWGEFELKVPGRHNALNATAAIVAGLQAGFSFQDCKIGLLQFQGVDRRFHFKGESKGIVVYDDYGHHPTEVSATLQAFREKFPDRRLVVMFQPHRYSRTQHCWHEFTTCFSIADRLILTDIYSAGESPIPGISSEKLVTETKHGSVAYFPKDQELVARITAELKSGDVFITLGAGDGWKVGMEVLEKLKAEAKKS